MLGDFTLLSRPRSVFWSIQICIQSEWWSWPVHISPMERPFWPSFWTLVDGSNELREIPLHYRAVPHRILWTFRKRVTRRFGDGRIFPPMNRSNLKSNIVSFWKGKCRKHYLRISIVNALPVNGCPTVVVVDGRTSFTHDVNGPSVVVGLQSPSQSLGPAFTRFGVYEEDEGRQGENCAPWTLLMSRPTTMS